MPPAGTLKRPSHSGQIGYLMVIRHDLMNRTSKSRSCCSAIVLMRQMRYSIITPRLIRRLLKRPCCGSKGCSQTLEEIPHRQLTNYKRHGGSMHPQQASKVHSAARLPQILQKSFATQAISPKRTDISRCQCHRSDAITHHRIPTFDMPGTMATQRRRRRLSAAMPSSASPAGAGTGIDSTPLSPISYRPIFS